MTDKTIKIDGCVSDEFVDILKQYGILNDEQKVKDIQTKAVDLYNALVGFKSDNLVITFDNGVKMEVTLSHEVKA